MTLHDRGPGRQPRRLGLYAPFALLLLGVAVWSVVWIWTSGEVYRQMEAERATLSRLGYDWRWSGRSISGYPFRLDLDLSDVSVSAASGWRLFTPKVSAEAMLLSPGHWVAVFPNAITRATREGGVATLRDGVLRASLSESDAHPPRLSVEGLDVAVDGAAAANPFFFSRAREFHLHTKSGPDDLGAIYLEVDQALAAPTGLIGGLADGKPVTLIADSIFTHAGALTGTDWRSRVIAWRKAGGELDVRTLHLSAGGSALDAKQGTLTVDEGGRLHGTLRVSSGGPSLSTIDFEPAATLLDSNALPPPPRVY